MVTEVYIGIFLILLAGLHAQLKFKFGRTYQLSDITLWFTYVGYGGAVIVAWLAGSTKLENWDAVGVVYVAVVLYGLGLIVASYITSRITYQPINRGQACAPSRSLFAPFFFAISALPLWSVYGSLALVVGMRAYAISVGGGFSGINTAEVNQSWSYPLVMINSLSEPLNFFLTAVSSVWIVDRYRTKMAIFILTTVFALAFMDGRRELLYIFITIAFVILFYRDRFKARYIFYGLAGVIFVFSVISPVFLATRMAIQKDALGNIRTSYFQSIGTAIIEGYSADESEREERGLKNLESRPLGARNFMLSLFDAQRFINPLMGSAFLQSQMLAVPRFLRWDASMAENPKVFVQKKYGLALGDVNHTAISSGIADFGLAGAFLVGLLVGIYLNLGIAYGLRVLDRMPFLGLYVFSLLWAYATNFEQSPGRELGNVRDIFIVFGLLTVLKAFKVPMRKALWVLSRSSKSVKIAR